MRSLTVVSEEIYYFRFTQVGDRKKKLVKSPNILKQFTSVSVCYFVLVTDVQNLETGTCRADSDRPTDDN